ncbi:MAG: hypothetical protein U1A27_08360 [Phycisphaerae bacterium]
MLRALPGVLLMLLAARLAADEPAAQSRVLLEHRLAPGQKRYVRIRTQTEKANVVSFFPNLPVVHDDREWWIVVEAQPPRPREPDTTLDWLIDRIQGRYHDGRNEVQFDSLRGVPPSQATTLATWANRRIRFQMDSRGKRHDMTPPPTSGPATARPNALTGMESPTANDWDQILTTFYQSYIADAPVAPGETWRKERRIACAPFGTLHGPVAYTLKSIDARDGRRVAQVSFAAQLQLEEDPAHKKDDRRLETRAARVEGALSFDVDAGELLALDETRDVKVDLIMTTRAPAPKPTSTRPGAAPTSAPGGGTTSQPAERVLTYTFQVSELRRMRVEVSRVAPVKPIVVVSSQPAPSVPVPPGPGVRPAPLTTRPAMPPPAALRSGGAYRGPAPMASSRPAER